MSINVVFIGWLFSLPTGFVTGIIGRPNIFMIAANSIAVAATVYTIVRNPQRLRRLSQHGLIRSRTRR